MSTEPSLRSYGMAGHFVAQWNGVVMGRFIPGYWTSVLVSVVLHEAAHLLMAVALKVKVKRIGLNWRGPYILREPGTPVRNTCVSLAGPGMNLVLCILFCRVAMMFAMVNGMLALFNLLPFIPSSDGQRVYRLWAHVAKAPIAGAPLLDGAAKKLA